MDLEIYFGDIHSHCDIAYGHGTLSAALKRAREQLDFCSVGGQLVWTDILQSAPPAEYPKMNEAHQRAFEHFSHCHQEAFRELWEGNEEGSFISYPSYEICCSEYGDHTILSRNKDLPLHVGSSAPEIAAGHRLEDTIIYPHHIGYKGGCRGIHWESFDENIAPFVEVYSLHGSSESDESFQPMQLAKRMTFRDGLSTVSHGLRLGKRFGLVAGTDHHSAWPGSHGQGRMAVCASSLTREAIWSAMKQRRVYALTGDNLRIRFEVERGFMGETIQHCGSRQVDFDIEACDFIDTIDLLRNERPIWQGRGLLHGDSVPGKVLTAKLRIEWGGVDPGTAIDFEGNVRVHGQLFHVDRCFHGPQVVSALQEDGEEPDLPHYITDQTSSSVSWKSRITEPPDQFWSNPQALVLTVRMRPEDQIDIDVNGKKFQHRLEDLLSRSVAHQLRGIHREGLRICRAVPESCFRFKHRLVDFGESEVDYYRLRVRQTNDQYAWTSPIWVER